MSSFIPPSSSGGQACIYQCENGRQQCLQLDQYRVQNCETNAQYERDRCIADIWARKNREPKWYECGGDSCSEDTDRCDTVYRSCYQSCGGQVIQETKCIANCDQIPRNPNPTPVSSSGVSNPKNYNSKDPYVIRNEDRLDRQY